MPCSTTSIVPTQAMTVTTGTPSLGDGVQPRRRAPNTPIVGLAARVMAQGSGGHRQPRAADGSSGAIAAVMGMTRGAVIGKVHRLGLLRTRQSRPVKPGAAAATDILVGEYVVAGHEDVVAGHEADHAARTGGSATRRGGG
jgi:hypothetical protein